MIARFAGAVLGLLAFAVTVIAGVLVQNPVNVTLSRSILALFLFCGIGFVLGGAAQLVVTEHEKNRELDIRDRCHKQPSGAEEATEAPDAASTPNGEQVVSAET